MPRYEVTSPDGKRFEVNAPDGATEAEVMAYAQSQFAQPKAWEPTKRSGDDIRALAGERDVTEEMSFPAQVGASFGRSFVETGRGIGQALGIVDQGQVDRSREVDHALLTSPGGFTGNLAGQTTQLFAPAGGAAKVLSVAGKAAPVVGAAIRGGAFTGSQTVGEDESRLGNTGEGAAYGALGQGVAAGVGKLAQASAAKLSPQVQALYQKAKAAGIDVHFSQLSDSKFVKTLASTLSYLPFSGGAAKARGQQEAFNAAIGRSFGAKDAKVLSDDVMDTAKQSLGAAYDKIFSGRTIGLDKQAGTALMDVHRTAARDLESGQAKVVQNQVVRIMDEFARNGSAMPGQVYQSLRSTLAKDFPKDSPIGRLVGQARKALDESAARSLGPAEAEALKRVNAAYSNFRTTKDVLKQVAGAGGNVKPAALWPAVRKGSTPEMRDLAKIGQTLLKDPIPDSGTAGRLLTAGLAGASGVAGGLPLLAQLALTGATVGRAANSNGLAALLAAGAPAKALQGLSRAARPLPKVLPALGPSLAAANDKTKTKKDKRRD